MRILLAAYKSDMAGGEQVVLQLAQGLRAAGEEVQAVCPAAGDLPDLLEREGVRVHLVPMRKTFDLLAVTRLARLLRDQRIELLHTHGLLVNVLGRLAARLVSGTASVSTVHLTMELAGAPRVGGLLARLKNRYYYRLLDNWTARCSDRVVAVSEAVREDLLRQGYPPTLVTVVRNAVDLRPYDLVGPEAVSAARRSLEVADGDTLVSAVCRLSPQKDLPTFFHALERLAQRFPRLRAVVAGTGPLEGELRALLARLGLERRVHLLGFRRDVPTVLKASDVFVLSSRWEGLPLTVLEAMAAGRPVVATAVPGTDEAVVPEETGLLVPIGSADALAEALARCLEAPDLARRLGAAGRRRVEEHFSLAGFHEAHLRLYRDVLRARGPRGTA